jgi:hypothetical protein
VETAEDEEKNVIRQGSWAGMKAARPPVRASVQLARSRLEQLQVIAATAQAQPPRNTRSCTRRVTARVFPPPCAATSA